MKMSEFWQHAVETQREWIAECEKNGVSYAGWSGKLIRQADLAYLAKLEEKARAYSTGGEEPTPRYRPDIAIRFDIEPTGSTYWVDWSSGYVSEDTRQFSHRCQTIWEAWVEAEHVCRKLGLSTSEIAIAPGRYPG